MRQITIRGIEPEIEKEIRRIAKSSRKSIRLSKKSLVKILENPNLQHHH